MNVYAHKQDLVTAANNRGLFDRLCKAIEIAYGWTKETDPKLTGQYALLHGCTNFPYICHTVGTDEFSGEPTVGDNELRFTGDAMLDLIFKKTKMLKIEDVYTDTSNLSEEEIEEMIEHIFDTINNVLVIRNIKMAREFKKWVEESTEIMEADKKVVAEIMDTPFFIDESKIKDYIHHPKENGYKALQFTLSITAYSTNIPGAQIEIQLKSQKMEEEAESGKASHEVYKKTGGHTTEELTDIDLLINEAFKITDFTQLHISGFYGNSEKEDRIGASQPDIFEIRHLSQSFVNKQ